MSEYHQPPLSFFGGPFVPPLPRNTPHPWRNYSPIRDNIVNNVGIVGPQPLLVSCSGIRFLSHSYILTATAKQRIWSKCSTIPSRWPLGHLETNSRFPHRPPRFGGRRVPYGNWRQRKNSHHGDVRNVWGDVGEFVAVETHGGSIAKDSV
jgi:hypothetical protein